MASSPGGTPVTVACACGTPGCAVTMQVDVDHTDNTVALTMTYRVTVVDLDTLRALLYPGPQPHTPDRDSDVAAWIKRERDGFPNDSDTYLALDWLLDDYRERADTGTPLDRPVLGPHPEEG